jgi:hypothetical protein
LILGLPIVAALCAGHHSVLSPLPDDCLEVIDTDRPHQTDTPHVVPPGHSQYESALALVKLGGVIGGPRDPPPSISAPSGRAARLVFFENAYKLGLVDDVDLQILFKHAEYVPAASRFEPPGPLGLRAKINFVHEEGWRPAVTLVPWVFVPVAPSQSLRGGPLVFWGWELPWRFELEMNAGVLFGASPKPPAALVLASALTHTITGNLRVFVDVYATGWDIAFGTGVLWAFTRDAQVDVGTYIGMSGDEPVASPFVGLSVRR